MFEVYSPFLLQDQDILGPLPNLDAPAINVQIFLQELLHSKIRFLKCAALKVSKLQRIIM